MLKDRNIALIGFRATGKSTVGKMLAHRLGLVFLDMDEHLVASFGRDIDCYVRSRGWEAFRDEESRLLAALASRRGMVVATGGGVVLDPANRRILKEHFFVVWLTASPDIIHARLVNDPGTASNRPALTALPLREEIEHLLRERSSLYRESADLVLSTEDHSARDLTDILCSRLSDLNTSDRRDF
ncbi:MAG: shikimate kinase [Syntrophobacteraceae bacterium]|nr:shikimate kinase [Syntrophobacteraceae bacterium]